MGVAALDGATDAPDTLVGLLGGQTLQGDLDSFVLFLEEIVVSGYRRDHSVSTAWSHIAQDYASNSSLKQFPLLSMPYIMLPPIRLVTSARKALKDSVPTSDRAGGSRKRSHTNWQRASASWSAKAASRRKERERPCRATVRAAREEMLRERGGCGSRIGPFREDCAKWDDSAGRKSWESSGCHVEGAKVATVFGGG